MKRARSPSPPRVEKHARSESPKLPDLPWELWAIVLGFVPADLYHVYRTVCRRWNGFLPRAGRRDLGRNPLDHIFQEGYFSLIRWLWPKVRITWVYASFHLALGGHKHIIEWTLENGGTLENVCGGAACGGHLNLLRWARSKGGNWDPAQCCAHAAENDDILMLEWIRDNGGVWEKSVCAAAARGGNLEVLQWLRNEGCPWDDETACNAALHGHLNVLRWVVETEYPRCWGTIIRKAAQGGNMDVVKWTCDKGYFSQQMVRKGAVSGGQVHVLDWLLSIGHSFTPKVWNEAAAFGQLRVLQWATENGCPWYKDECRDLAARFHRPAVVEWIDAMARPEVDAQGDAEARPEVDAIARPEVESGETPVCK